MEGCIPQQRARVGSRLDDLAASVGLMLNVAGVYPQGSYIEGGYIVLTQTKPRGKCTLHFERLLCGFCFVALSFASLDSTNDQ